MKNRCLQNGAAYVGEIQLSADTVREEGRARARTVLRRAGNDFPRNIRVTPSELHPISPGDPERSFCLGGAKR